MVAYATMDGSTMEVAEAVGEETGRGGVQIELLPTSEMEDFQNYDGVVVGGPMIMGWHREEFQKISLAGFVVGVDIE